MTRYQQRGLWIWSGVIVLLLSTLALPQEPLKKLTFRDATSFRSFFRMPSGVEWLPDGKQFSHIKRNRKTLGSELWVYNPADGSEKLYVAAEKLLMSGKEATSMGGSSAGTVTLNGYQWLPDGSGLLLNSGNNLWHYDHKTRRLNQLTETEDAEELFDVSPNGRYISFVRGHNLYVYDRERQRETQLTNDGSDVILNGKFDWVYQEELVGRGQYKAYFWSPNSDRIAFLRFDQNNVPVYPLVDTTPVHPKVTYQRHSKPGDPNSLVTLGVITLENREIKWIDTGEETDVYFPRVYWLPSGKEVAFMRLDRRQQNLEFLFADAASGKSRVVVKDSDEHWVNVGDYVHFFEKKQQFLWGAERENGYNHLYIYDYNGKLVKQITSGEWFVDQLSAVDEKNGEVYFTATEKDIRERHLYRVKTNGRGFKRISDNDGMHRINMAPGGGYYLDTHSSINEPTGVMVRDRQGKATGELMTRDTSIQDKFDLPSRELFTFTGDNGLEYYASITKPADFDPNKKYPVIVAVYGGPHAQTVRNSAGRGNWNLYLSQKGCLIFRMDNRGAAGRGHHWETPVHKNMGAIELEDQLRGVAYLKSLPYVDGDRIAITGGSYGGYMTLYAMTNSDAFCAGISVSPVTDWRFYDTAYTERYMGLPAENPEGYKTSAPTNSAANLSGELLLIHGDADDNVHIQNAIEMVDALIDAGKQFQLMIYPDQGHGIRSPADRRHYFEMQEAFWDRHLFGVGSAE